MKNIRNIEQFAEAIGDVYMNGLSADSALIHVTVTREQFQEIEQEYIQSHSNSDIKFGLNQIGFEFNGISIIILKKRDQI